MGADRGGDDVDALVHSVRPDRLDADYDRIAAITNQPTEWIVEKISL